MTDHKAQWEPALSVGVAKLDGHHRDLFQKSLSLKDALDAVCGTDACGPDDPARHDAFRAMVELRSQFAAHFAAEESLLARVRYPGLAEHKREHDRCLLQLMGYERALLEGQVAVVGKARLGIPLWLRQHIQRFDQPYAAFLKSRANRPPAAAPEAAAQAADPGPPATPGSFDEVDDELLRERFEKGG